MSTCNYERGAFHPTSTQQSARSLCEIFSRIERALRHMDFQVMPTENRFPVCFRSWMESPRRTPHRYVWTRSPEADIDTRVAAMRSCSNLLKMRQDNPSRRSEAQTSELQSLMHKSYHVV